jgi:hypothetical protein
MKKSVILAILGLSVAAVSSYGQGSVAFNTYTALNGTGILTTYGNGGSIGSGIGNTFAGILMWSATNPGDAASTALTAGNPLNPLLQSGSGGTGTFLGGAQAGYITGSNLNLTSGQVAAGGTIYCEVVAFNGSAWGNGSYQGHSASFAVTVASGTTLPDGNQLNGMAPFSVYAVAAVPEPTTMALGGLGLASLLLFRRKQA